MIRFDENLSENQPNCNLGDKVYLRESQLEEKLQNKFCYTFKFKTKTKVNLDRRKLYFEE